MNWKEFTMKYGGGLTKYQKKGEVQSSSLKPEQMNFKYKTAHGYKFPEYNAALIPKGTEAVQKYQKMLNETYGTFLAEDGAWGPETQKAYERFIVNKETPQPFEKTKYRPYLGEFKKMYERMPSYNYGYESLRDADPTTMGVQQGPLTQERTQQVQGLPSEEELRQSYLGKTFGGLPMFQGSDIYEGYSPNRTWLDKDPYTGYQNPREAVEKLATNPRYAYMLTPKPGTTLEQNINNPVNDDDYLEFKDGNLVKIKDPQGFKNLINYVINDPKFLKSDLPYQEVVDKFKNFEEKDWSDPKKISEVLYPEGDKESANFFRRNVLNSKNFKIPYTPIYWREGDAIASDFAKNPEIAEYMKDKGITLAGGYRYADKNNLPKSKAFTSQLGESVLAQRDAAINKRPFGFAGSGWGSPVIQDPNMFNLSGYIPITEDMFYVDPRGTMQSYWDNPAKRKEYLLKAGVPEDQLDKVYINTSTFPIQEYKPRKDAQGNIYQYGGGLPIYQKKGEFNWKTYKDVGIQTLPSKSQIAAAQGQQRDNVYVNPVVKNAAQLQRINQIQEQERQRRIQETADRVQGTLRATTDADIEAQNREDYTLTGRARSLGRGDFNPLVVVASAADLINPASYWYTGKDLGRGVKQTGEGLYNLDPEQAASGLFQTGLSALQLYPGASTARSVIRGAAPRLFGSAMSNQADDFLRSVRSIDDFATTSPPVYRTQPGLSSGPISSTSAVSGVDNSSNVVSDINSLANEFLGYAFKNKGNKEAIARGNAWLQNWIKDPVTQAKIERDLGWIPQRGNVLKDKFDLGYEQAKGYVPISSEYPLNKQLSEFASELFSTKKAYRPNVHTGNLGTSYIHFLDPSSRNIRQNDPLSRYSGSWISRSPVMSQAEREYTTIHEGTHDWVSDFLLKESGQSEVIKNILSKEARERTAKWKDLRSKGQNPVEVMGKEEAKLAYLGDPTEIHARIMELRRQAGMTPEVSKNITPEQAFRIINYLKNNPKQSAVDARFFNVIDNDPKKLAKLFRELWAIPATVGIGAGAYQQFNQKPQGTYQYGGPTIDLKLPQFEEDKPRPFFEITGAGTVPQYDVFGYGYVPLGKNLGISADLMSFKEGDWRGGRYGISGNINIPINRGERRTRPDVKDLPIYQKRGEVSYSSVVDPKTKRINLEAFDRLQSLLKEQELIAQSRPEGAKAIPEIQIIGERPGLGSRIRNAIKPYVAPEGGFLDQWRQRIVDATGGADWYKQPNSVLNAFSSIVTSPLQAPQYAAVYAATDGKLQLPSEALNIQNPVGSFLTDVALDPMTYVGLGVSKIPQKIGQAAIPSIEQAGKYLTTQTPLRNTYKINPWRFRENPEAYYHRSPDLQNIINQKRGTLQGFGASEAGKLFNQTAGPGRGLGLNLKKPANSELYFSKGVPLDYGRTNMVLDKSTGKLIPGQGYEGPYLVEVTNTPFVAKANGKFRKVFDPETGEYVRGKLPPTGRGHYAVSKEPISIDNAKFYKEDWLRGYKPVEINKQLPGSPNTINQAGIGLIDVKGAFQKYPKGPLTQEEITAYRNSPYYQKATKEHLDMVNKYGDQWRLGNYMEDALQEAIATGNRSRVNSILYGGRNWGTSDYITAGLVSIAYPSVLGLHGLVWAPPAVRSKVLKNVGIQGVPGGLSSDDTTIDLTNRNMNYAKVNQTADGKIIIGGEFIEDTNNTVRKAKDWLTATDTYSDKKYPSKDIQSFYGIENGKFKVGKANEFNPETEIVPRRFGAINIDKAVLNGEEMRLLDKQGNPIYQNTPNTGKFILYSPSTGKAQFTYINTGKSGVNKVNDFLKKNKDAQYIHLDNGRYEYYGINPEGLTEQDFKNYYEQDFKREGNPGYNMILKKYGGDELNPNPYMKEEGGETNLFNWNNLDQWFKNGGESDFVNNIYSDYMDGVYDDTPLEENARKVYDKLNNMYYRLAKESGMTPPNYIMTNVIKKALNPS